MNEKMIIAIILSIIVLACAFVAKKKFFGDKKVSKTGSKHTESQDCSTEDESTQNRLPVADIRGSVLLQRDGTAISYVKVVCKNSSLLNLKELEEEVARLAPCIAAQQTPFKLLHIQRPVDSSANLARLEACDENYLVMMADFSDKDMGFKERQALKQLEKRRWLLAHYQHHAELEIKQTSKTVSEAYICLPVKYAVGNEELAYQLACDVRERLKASGYVSKVLWAEEIASMCLAYGSAYRSANENVSPATVSPLIKGYDYEKNLTNPHEKEEQEDYDI